MQKPVTSKSAPTAKAVKSTPSPKASAPPPPRTPAPPAPPPPPRQRSKPDAPAAKGPVVEATVVPPPQVPPPPRSGRIIPTIIPMPGAASEVVNNVICRDLIEADLVETEMVPDPTLSVLDSLVSGIVNGTDIEHIKTEIQRMLSSQREKAEIVNAMMRTHDYWRVAQWLRVRNENERRIFSASRRGDLTSAEALAFLRVANAEIEAFKADKTELQPDSGALLDRMDNTEAKREKSVAENFKGTTPHGREIVRKRLEAEKKRAAAEAAARR